MQRTFLATPPYQSPQCGCCIFTVKMGILHIYRNYCIVMFQGWKVIMNKGCDFEMQHECYKYGRYDITMMMPKLSECGQDLRPLPVHLRPRRGLCTKVLGLWHTSWLWGRLGWGNGKNWQSLINSQSLSWLKPKSSSLALFQPIFKSTASSSSCHW